MEEKHWKVQINPAWSIKGPEPQEPAYSKFATYEEWNEVAFSPLSEKNPLSRVSKHGGDQAASCLPFAAFFSN